MNDLEKCQFMVVQALQAVYAADDALSFGRPAEAVEKLERAQAALTSARDAMGAADDLPSKFSESHLKRDF